MPEFRPAKPMPGRSRRLSAVRIGGALIGAATLGLSACSSAAAGGASPSGSSSASGTSNAQAAQQAAAAKTQVIAAMKAPSALGVTVPLKTKPPSGKTVVFLQCDVPQCAVIESGVAAAAHAIGWKLHVINFQNANPATLVSGMQEALQYKPVAVALTGLPESSWSSVIPAYKAAGVSIVAMAQGPDTINSTVISNPAGIPDNQVSGQMIANWFIADSKGEGHALVVSVPAFPILQAASAATASTIQSKCSACKVTTLAVTLTEVGDNGVVPAIVSAIRKDPSIKYVLSSEGAFTAGLPSALTAAGISGVKLAGEAPSLQDMQALQTGTEYAWAPTAFTYEGWLFIDSAARHLEGMPITAGDGGLPNQLMTKANVGTPSATLNAPSNFPALFENLWHVG